MQVPSARDVHEFTPCFNKHTLPTSQGPPQASTPAPGATQWVRECVHMCGRVCEWHQLCTPDGVFIGANMCIERGAEVLRCAFQEG